MDDLVAKTQIYVRKYMDHYDSSHDFHHIERVYGLAKRIEAAELICSPSIILDSTIVTLACLLHDVGDRKYLRPGEDGASLVLDFLLANGAGPDVAEKVQTIVNHVSYSSEIKDPAIVAAAIEKYPELAIVQDADRLDAMGAVGIGRCFTYNASRSSKGSMDAAVFHFDDKLLPRAALMKTKTGKRLAVERADRIVTFQKWWQEEIRYAPHLSS